MTGRHTVNTITSDALDALYDRLDRIRAELDRIEDFAKQRDDSTTGPYLDAVDTLRTALDQAAPAATEIDSSPLRDRIAAALYERERPPRDPHWPDVYAMDREVFEAMADAVLPVVQPELDALAPAAAEADPFSYEERERTGRNAGLVFPAATETAAWTPPPPGDRREQLPNHLIDLIRDQMPDYLSTACQTADTLGCAACYPRSGIPRPQYDEIREHAERLHQRCRRNQKFTGQLCACGCHGAKQTATPAAPSEATDTLGH